MDAMIIGSWLEEGRLYGAVRVEGDHATEYIVALDAAEMTGLSDEQLTERVLQEAALMRAREQQPERTPALSKAVGVARALPSLEQVERL